MEKIELRCLGCGEPLDVMPSPLHDGSGFFQLVSPCNNCIDEELKFFRNSFPRAAANYFKVSSQQLRAPDVCSACEGSGIDPKDNNLYCEACGGMGRSNAGNANR